MLPQSYQYPNLPEGADRVAGQLRGDKECPFSGVTRSGRVWRKVPERDAGSVLLTLTCMVSRLVGECGGGWEARRAGAGGEGGDVQECHPDGEGKTSCRGSGRPAAVSRGDGFETEN